jgi:hypothetical protein
MTLDDREIHQGSSYTILDSRKGLRRRLPGSSNTAADTLRFQQSLVFTGGSSNRSDDTIRAIREACRGAAFNPAGLDDPRCPGGAPQ